MAKVLKVKDPIGEKFYKLEFNRAIVAQLEKQGLRITEVQDIPVSSITSLVYGAFRMHHPQLSRETIDKIFERISNKSAFIEKLVEMYAEPIQTLMEEPEESEGNATWTEE